MRIWRNHKIRCQEAKEDLLTVVIISEEIFTGMHTENSPEKSTQDFFQEKAVICFIYIPENFYYGNRYYDIETSFD